MSSWKVMGAIIIVGAATAVVSLATADTVTSPPTIQLEKAVHFTTPSGEDVLVGPGTYEVEAAKAGLRLTPKDGKPEEATVIQASPMPHGESLIEPKAQSEPGIGPDAYRIALLLPDRNGLQATGSYSGIRTRGGLANVTYGTTLSANSGSYNTAIGTGALQNNTTGEANTAMGVSTLYANTTGSNNTATGVDVLRFNTTGNFNTATGILALWANTTGNFNTATGSSALRANTTGGGNTATGYWALTSNTTGGENTATGSSALRANTTGGGNTAVGVTALTSNTTGGGNTATGHMALLANTTGSGNTAMGVRALQYNNSNQNTATGWLALYANTTGGNNTAMGVTALEKNTVGMQNTAIGRAALGQATQGSYNTAIGDLAGFNQTYGSNNIYINNGGVASESWTIRIGTANAQGKAFIAGVTGVPVSGTPVVVDANGQLGIQGSSLRYKDDIRDLGTTSEGLHQLRPVSFRYKADMVAGAGDASRDVGLIAEEVAEVYPELVGRDAEGQIVTVKYHALIPMLLNELQQEHKHNQNQDRLIVEQRQQIEALRAEVAELKAK